MDKYLALFNYLSSIKNNTISLFFSEIEKIINIENGGRTEKIVGIPKLLLGEIVDGRLIKLILIIKKYILKRK